MSTIVLWIDADIDNEENKEFIKELKSIGSLRLKLFSNIENAIEQLKYLEFQETKIIISDIFYSEFVKSFKENILDMYVAPKIIVYTKNKENFIQENNDYTNEENKFFTSGGIATTFNELKEFLIDKKEEEIRKQDEVQLTFDYIDKKEKLILPLFFKSLIDKVSNENIENYTKKLYETYSNDTSSKDYKKISELFGLISSIKNIPIEILSRYYSRLYTADSNFHRNINKDLGLNKKENYLPFIKTLYEGVKLKSLSLSNEKMLYRGSKISNEEINLIKDYLNKKIEGLPSSIVFSKSFLSFSKDKRIAENFLRGENKNTNLSKVLFILEKDNNIGYNLSTHGDLEKISFFPNEREVLFFPFSSFEIKGITEKNIQNETIYEIKLLYLGKYLKDIVKDKNLINNEITIPDSEFKKQIEDFGLIKKEKIQTINTKQIYKEFKKYEKEIKKKELNNNTIIGEIYIKPEDVGKDIQIINSYENYKRINNFDIKEDDWKYENEIDIKENIEIKINEKIIEFSYVYKFEEEGKYQIEYLLLDSLTKTNHMFYNCTNITNLNLSNFNTENVTDMSCMFQNCKSLANLNLTNLDTQNVINMCGIFMDCNSLTKLDLSNFNTQNVTDMYGMCNGCKSLVSLNLSSFNTQNVTDMGSMFNCCKSLKSLDLSSFNTQNVTNMGGMFDDCNLLNNIDLSNFNTENVTNMSIMFYGCNSLTSLDLSNFNTQNVNNMDSMFHFCKSLTSLDLSNFNTQNVRKMGWMFSYCNSLTNLNITSFNTQNVEDMSNLFYDCNSLTSLDLSSFNTQKATNMSKMFQYCKSLLNLNLSNFYTQNVTDMNCMFYGCNSLVKLNLSNFNTQNVSNMNEIFNYCNSLKKDNIITKDNKILNLFS